jgi:hypothetical protein
MSKAQEAIELAIEILMYIGGTIVVLWFVNKLIKADQIIEGAKNIPGGMNYVEPAKPKLSPSEEEEEFEELSWRAHA